MTRRVFLYILILAAAVLVVVALLQIGAARWPARDAEAVAAPAPTTGVWTRMLDNTRLPVPHLILQLVVIILVAQAFGVVARRVGQPPVIGEIVAGVLLGPSLLGWIAPDISGFLFPASSLPMLQLLSQIGVLLFMFVVGVELEPSYLRGKAQTAIAVSHFGIVIPFAFGVALSLALYGQYAPAGVPFHAFGLFCGIALSITAFPVLARILEARNLTHTPLGATAIACAAVNDVTAWTILAFVVAITTAGGAMQTLFAMVALSAAFVFAMIAALRPFLQRLLKPDRMGDSLDKPRLAVVLIVLLSSALVTEIIGIHALFGAFIAGAIMPAGRRFRAALRDRLESLGSVFLLPLFFVHTGLRTQIGLLDSAMSWAICLGIVAVATAGKLGGTVLAARWTGLQWRDAVALGALMNTRGLMELIALNVGYDLGILTPEIFAMMVLMALVTTMMTGPLLSLAFNWNRVRAIDPRTFGWRIR
jgi:Kef-type K+ transport system membrane component KefB